MARGSKKRKPNNQANQATQEGNNSSKDSLAMDLMVGLWHIVWNILVFATWIIVATFTVLAKNCLKGYK